MKVLHNHHSNNPTVIIGDMASNTGDLFPIHEAAVSHIEENEGGSRCVILPEVLTVVHSTTLDDHLTDADVCAAVAVHGLPTHLDVLVAHPDTEVRCAVACHGGKKHLDILVHDPKERVRTAVVIRGFKRHLTVLVNDPSETIRMTVAALGNEKHRVALESDPSKLVRIIVKGKRKTII